LYSTKCIFVLGNNMQKDLKLFLIKLWYYRDFRLLFFIFFTSLRMPYTFFPSQNKKLTDLTNPNIRSQRRKLHKDKIKKYVNFYFYLLKQFGFKSTCLTRSAFLCCIGRKLGFQAHIHFGIPTSPEKNYLDPSFLGHCWVNIEGDDFIEDGYETLQKYPVDQ